MLARRLASLWGWLRPSRATRPGVGHNGVTGDARTWRPAPRMSHQPHDASLWAGILDNPRMVGGWERVLVLAPHTDDGEFGCGGTMARLVEGGAEVRYVAFSNATKSLPEGFPPDTLGREVKEATSELGIPESHLTVHDFEVRTFPQYRQDILELLIELWEDWQPHAVFQPSVHDIHQDHQVVAAETGFPGLLLFLWLVVTALLLAFRRLARDFDGAARLVLGLALVAILVHCVFYNALFEDPTFWGLLALVAVGARVPEAQPA